MRIIHTSDWHIGQELRGYSRLFEHSTFLDWLRNQCTQHRVDGLVVAGDVFDQANPSSEAQRLFFRFIDATLSENPELQIVAIAGNHDSSTRFDALAPALRTRFHFIGGVSRKDSVIDAERLVVPVGDGFVIGTPYFKLPDLPIGEHLNTMSSRVRSLYAEVWDAAAPRIGSSPCAITGHLTVIGGQESPDSERPIFIGGEQAASLDVFPSEAGYVALGHLHRAQQLADGRVRYSGSPFPMSASEINYRHRIAIANIGPRGSLSVQEIDIPRPVEHIRIGDSQRLSPDQALEFLGQRAEELGVNADTPLSAQPFADIHVSLEAPRPQVATQLLEDARRSRLPVRIIRVSASVGDQQREGALTHSPPVTGAPRPEDLFTAAYSRAHSGEQPSTKHLNAFRTLLEGLPT